MNIKEVILSNIYIVIVSILTIIIVNTIDPNPLDCNGKWTVLAGLSAVIATAGTYIIYQMTKKKEFLWSLFSYGLIAILFFAYSLTIL